MPPRTYPQLDVNSDFGGRFPWKSRHLDVGNDLRLAYVEAGPKDAAITFVCLHGNPTWGYLYRHFIEGLSKEYRVIVPDHVGFGRSDKPHDPAYYTLERHIANLTLLLNERNAQNVVPIMQDWGGPIGCGWATRHPARTAGFVVLNTWAFAHDPPMRLPFLFRLLVLGKGGWKRATKNNLFTELFVGKAQKLEGEALDPYRAPHPMPEDRVGVARFPQLVPPTSQPRHESHATMSQIEKGLEAMREKPALIVWARKDPAFRKAYLERWTQLFANVDGPHLLPDAHHYLQESHGPQIVEHVQRWARGLSKTRSRVVSVAARAT